MLPEPYEWQLEVLESDKYLRVVVGGRRVGLTTLCALATIKYANARILWLTPNYRMTLVLREMLAPPELPPPIFSILDRNLLEGIKGWEFDLVIVDELLPRTLEENLQYLKVLYELRRRHTGARWLVVGTPSFGRWQLPFPALWQLPDPLELFYDRALSSPDDGAAWRIPADENAEWARMLSEEQRQTEVLAEFISSA